MDIRRVSISLALGMGLAHVGCASPVEEQSSTEPNHATEEATPENAQPEQAAQPEQGDVGRSSDAIMWGHPGFGYRGAFGYPGLCGYGYRGLYGYPGFGYPGCAYGVRPLYGGWGNPGYGYGFGHATRCIAGLGCVAY